MGMRRLLDNPHDAISEQLDDLEERLDDAEHDVSSGLVPNHDHAELTRSVDAIRSDISRIEHEMTHVATLPIATLEPLEGRVRALEERIDQTMQAAEEHAHEGAEEVEHGAEEAIELPAEIVVPKKVHPMRHPSWPRIF